MRGGASLTLVESLVEKHKVDLFATNTKRQTVFVWAEGPVLEYLAKKLEASISTLLELLGGTLQEKAKAVATLHSLSPGTSGLGFDTTSSDR